MLWLLAFVWTNALELPVYTLLLQRRFDAWWSVVALTIGVNTLTHPAVWFLFPRFEPFWQYAIVAELSVIAVETIAIAAVLARRTTLRDALVTGARAAACANVVSFVIGRFVLRALA